MDINIPQIEAQSALQFLPAPVQSDVLALSPGLDVNSLVVAYRNGLFPWPTTEDELVPWFSPFYRGVLHFSQLHVPRSLQKFINKSNYIVATDTCFDKVIDKCGAVARNNQPGTWITSQVNSAYKQLHRQGVAHSIEVFEGNTLVGGLYGVFINNVFSGESMFHTHRNASKIALLTLVATLKANGIRWIDIQMVTELLEALGGAEMERSHYYKMLRNTQAQPITDWPGSLVQYKNRHDFDNL